MNYQVIRNKAARLVARYGVGVEIVREGSDTTWTRKYDPAQMRTYWEDGAGTVVYTAPASVEVRAPGHALIGDWPVEQIGQQGIEAEDVMMTVTTTAEIRSGDKVVLATGREYLVALPIDRVSPAGETLIVQIVNGRS